MKHTVSLHDIRRNSTLESELFEGDAGRHPQFASTPHLVNNGGPILKNVQVIKVYLGAKWNAPEMADLIEKLDAFTLAYIAGPMVEQVGEYGVGAGTLLFSTVIDAEVGEGVQSISDRHIRSLLLKWVNKGKIPAPNPSTLYRIYVQPGTVVSMSRTERSCKQFCGYHDAIIRRGASNLYYAVLPYPTCDGCLGGMSAFDALCGTSTHEICEVVTDPIPGKTYYDDRNGEVGDICAWQFKTVPGVGVVQLEWSNAQGKCI